MASATDLLVWIDCEMTGLDVAIDELVEVAVVLTAHDPTRVDREQRLEDRDLLGGERLADANVRAAHLGFYRRYPGFVDEGLRRHAETIRALQL